MPISIDCRATYLGSVAPLEAGFLNTLLREVESRFLASSSNDIVMTCREVPLDAHASISGSSPSTVDLHAALGSITRNLAAPVRRIGLIFSGSWGFQTDQIVLGIMFDRGFNVQAPDDNSQGRAEIPREGCAVFLDTIAERRLAEGAERDGAAAFEEEVRFTTIHELGHVFNLGHLGKSEKSFMMSSADRPKGDMSAFRFSDHHQEILSECSRNATVQPGGSPWNGPSGFPQGWGGEYEGASNRLTEGESPLRLKIGIATPEFLHYQPVELDIELGCVPGLGHAIRIANHVDCGYADFTLWIEDPDGEVRRYRPINHYCSVEGEIEITANEPFRRDISIFGQSGGYTFSKPGNHKLWAELRISPATCVRSNVLEIAIMGRTSMTHAELDHRDLMYAAAPALFYRSARLKKATAAALKSLSESAGRDRVLDRAAGCYSRGRLLAKNVLEGGKKSSRALPVRLLETAAANEHLGVNRRQIAMDLVGKLKSM